MNKMNPNVYLFSLGHFSVDWCQGAIPALLPYFIATCHLSYQEAGTLIFANMLLSSVSQPLFGYYSDKISKPWFVPLGPILCGLCITLLGFTQSYALIFLASMFSGLGSSIYHPEAARMVNQIAGEQKGKAMSSFSVGGNAGFAIGPMVAAFCAYTFDPHALAVFGLVNLILAFLLYHRMGKLLHLIKKTVHKAKQAAKNAVVPSNDWRSFGKLSIVIFVRSVSFSLCNSFVPIYWITVLGTTPAQGSMALSTLFLIGAIVTYLGGVLADRFGFVRILRMSMLTLIPSMFLLFSSHSIALSTALLIPAAVALFACYSPIVVLGQSYLAKNVGFASGVTLGLNTTIGGLMMPLVGWAADTYGVENALQILWIIAIGGAIASYLLPVPAALKKSR